MRMSSTENDRIWMFGIIDGQWHPAIFLSAPLFAADIRKIAKKEPIDRTRIVVQCTILESVCSISCARLPGHDLTSLGRQLFCSLEGPRERTFDAKQSIRQALHSDIWIGCRAVPEAPQ